MMLDIDFINQLLNASLFGMIWLVLKNGGWVILVIGFFKIAQLVWLKRVRADYESKRQFVLLALNIPKLNEQSPKAVEQIFAQIHGALDGANFIEKWWEGKTQERFSFEIVSSGGYIRYYVWTPVPFRDLVEAAFFSQYPDAEIVEVDDYTHGFPHHFPDKEWEMFGTELTLAKEEAYPLRTYAEFEHTMSQEFKDPLAGMLESMSKLRPDENIWFQYVLQPASDHWKEHSEHTVAFLTGAHVEHKESWFVTVMRWPIEALEFFGSFIFPAGEGGHDAGGHGDEAPSQIQYMTPGEKNVLEGVQNKAAKIGFYTKIRFMYIAKRESFNKARGVVPIFGAMNQFSTQDMNAIVPVKYTMTKGGHVLKARRLASRQRKLMHAYHLREDEAGAGEGKVLNIEELATVYHFPAATVKAPLIKKTQAKEAEPPFALPVSEGYTARPTIATPSTPPHAVQEEDAPDDLPFA